MPPDPTSEVVNARSLEGRQHDTSLIVKSMPRQPSLKREAGCTDSASPRRQHKQESMSISPKGDSMLLPTARPAPQQSSPKTTSAARDRQPPEANNVHAPTSEILQVEQRYIPRDHRLQEDLHLSDHEREAEQQGHKPPEDDNALSDKDFERSPACSLDSAMAVSVGGSMSNAEPNTGQRTMSPLAARGSACRQCQTRPKHSQHTHGVKVSAQPGWRSRR